MHFFQHQSFVATLFAVFSLWFTGCISYEMEPMDPVIPIRIGAVTIEEADSEAGLLRGTYDHHGHIVTFEATRREQNPEGNDGPIFEVDARLCDAREFCFALASGGHGLTDPSWSPNLHEAPNPMQVRINHESAMGFHEELLSLDSSILLGLEEELETLVLLSNFDPPEQVDAGHDPSETESSLKSGTGGYTHRLQIWKKPVLAPLGHHSSTRVISIASDGYWIMTMNTSNHGTQPGGTGMSVHCTRDFPSRPVWLAVTTPCSAPATNGAVHSPGDTASCCSTTYGLINGRHVCNDDTHLQRDMTILNASIVPSYCSDAIEPYAPSCW